MRHRAFPRPFRDRFRSRDGLSCLLSLVPGDEAAPAPEPEDVLSRAEELGFPAASLLPAHEIESMMRDAILRGTPLESVSISPG